MTRTSQCQAVGEAPPQTWKDYERGCLLTYSGGHHTQETREAFRHGMQTVFNLLKVEFPEAWQCKEGRGVLDLIAETLVGCPDCDYDEAEGNIYRHCDHCLERCASVAFAEIAKWRRTDA